MHKQRDFKENLTSSFGELRDGHDFSDVTLACNDGHEVRAHKVILAASSPFFHAMLRKTKNPHPLIFMRGCDLQDLTSVVDFLYKGEVDLLPEKLDSFLALAQDLKIKGLPQKESNGEKEDISRNVKEDISRNVKYVAKGKDIVNEPTDSTDFEEPDVETASDYIANPSISLSKETPAQFMQMQALDEKVKSIMAKSQNKIKIGTKLNGTPMYGRSFICKVCGKEGQFTNIRDHIEAKHLEGISIPCNFCDRTCISRYSLRYHIRRNHKSAA